MGVVTLPMLGPEILTFQHPAVIANPSGDGVNQLIETSFGETA